MGFSRWTHLIKSSFTETARLNYRLIMSQRHLVTLRPGGEIKGKVLLSYISHPFVAGKNSPASSRHSNIWQCREMVKIWNDLGYAVDVIDWDNRDFLPSGRYDFFIDIHGNMERLAPLVNADCVKILYVTGAHWLFQNRAEYDRLALLQQRRGVTICPQRIAPPASGAGLADYLIILGNDFTAGTFRYAGKPAYLLNNCATRVFPEPLRRDPGKCRKSYLWMGGSGLVLKGLDLVLEAFASLPGYSLTVCGPVEGERDFRDAFHTELYQTPNIRTIGFVDLDSERFSGIARECIAIIYPSASEGQAGSVIDCMHAGLIPLVSCSSGVDPGPGGFILEDVSARGIREAVRMVSGLSGEELVRRSQETWSYAMANYTREKFSGDYRRIITEIIAETGAGKGMHESTVR